MSESDEKAGELCGGCVYYPPNLPEQAYAREDWLMLQEKDCSYEYQPGDADCKQTRKTSCSIVDLNSLPQSSFEKGEN
jgi:hypothetical protein